MEELNSLEKRIYSFVQKHNDIVNENSELKTTVNKLEKENEVLNLKLEELEQKIKSITEEDFDSEFLNLSPEEKNILKNKIGDLISRIDYHLRS